MNDSDNSRDHIGDTNDGENTEGGHDDARGNSGSSGGDGAADNPTSAGRARPWRRAHGPAGPAGTSPSAPVPGRSRPRTAARTADRPSTPGPTSAAGTTETTGAGDGVGSAAPVPYWDSGDGVARLFSGDAVGTLRGLPADHVDSVVTSPPYWGLRDYGAAGQYGLEPTPDAYVDTLRLVFREIARVLRPTGTVWLNLGDSYAAGPPGRTADPMRRSTLSASSSALARRELVRAAGAVVDRTRFLPRKSLMGMPWRVAMALQTDGWILRNAVIWHKPAPMPDPVRDRFTAAHEFVFLLVRQGRYFFDLDAVRSSPSTGRVGRRRSGRAGDRTTPRAPGGHRRGRNPGDVWTIPRSPYRGAHFATMPLGLAARCIAAGSPRGGAVLDPFSGAGTTGVAALTLGRRCVGIELNDAYNELAKNRLSVAHAAAWPTRSDNSSSSGENDEHERPDPAPGEPDSDANNGDVPGEPAGRGRP